MHWEAQHAFLSLRLCWPPAISHALTMFDRGQLASIDVWCMAIIVHHSALQHFRGRDSITAGAPTLQLGFDNEISRSEVSAHCLQKGLAFDSVKWETRTPLQLIVSNSTFSRILENSLINSEKQSVTGSFFFSLLDPGLC